MNPYKTPCTPFDCDSYTIDGCKMQTVCDGRIKYEELKQTIRQEKAVRGQSFAQRSDGVDAIYKSLRGNKHRVGQI